MKKSQVLNLKVIRKYCHCQNCRTEVVRGGLPSAPSWDRIVYGPRYTKWATRIWQL